MPRCLKEIAQVQVGYSFRSRLEACAGGAPVVQMKDLTWDDVVDCRELQRVEVGEVKDSQLLRLGDLVFRSRGMDMSPALMVDEPREAIILAAPLYRVRVNSVQEVLPEYLNWYLHQDEAQAYLASRIKGTAQKMVSKNSLEGLPVDLPDLPTQQVIVDMAALLQRELTLLEALSERRRALISTQLMQLAKGEN
ncbi:restriction endonuclease subunit S [Coraliomargarita algicola]|uniref:Restriction endonuclease subunit S n=1 Tax=Coraliomargarita algicola TaxID=3092156 RepID=A0ABZ0RSL4_9BACT|nr:restriction endonuclease subunit S [Coraliomargarita sp. J2-16]WPJ97775.1 restriction endonuclease subunit S [Coraliomargarita sp. J2-16]